MTLTSGERSAIAAAVEAAIIDDTDSNAVLEAIVNKIAEVNPDLGDLTVQSIAAAARDATLNAILANFDSEGSIGEAIASILAKVAPLPADPASETIATSNKNAITSAISGLHNVSTAQVQSAAAAAIAAYDPPTRSELTSDKNEIMGAIPSASSTASAVRSELNTELQRIDATISSRLAPSTEGRTLNVGEDGSVVTEFDPQALQEALQEVFESGDLSLTVASFSPAAIAQLAARKQLVVLHCGVVVSGKMRLIQGDAYRDDLGNALDFSREDFPDLDGAETVHFSAQLLPTAQHSETIQLTGSIVETTGVKVLRFEVSSEQSIEWTPGNYEARVLVTFPNGNTRTFLTFTLEVLGKIG